MQYHQSMNEILGVIPNIIHYAIFFYGCSTKNALYAASSKAFNHWCAEALPAKCNSNDVVQLSDFLS